MKKFFKVIGIFLAVLAVLAVLVFIFTSGIVNSAEMFFKDIKAKDYSNAYRNPILLTYGENK